MKALQTLILIIVFLIQASVPARASTAAPKAPLPALKVPALPRFEAKNWGLTEKGANILQAWTITQGSKNVIVAVIDTGIDGDSLDLKNNLWKAPTSTSGSSHVGNGSVFGYDFVTKSYNPRDSHGHGTHIAGIIGGKLNAKTGTAGVAQNVQIMAVRYYDETAPGKTNLANTIKSLNYAIDNGAKIINYSGGGPEYSQEEFEAMQKAEKKGVLIVTAAGNDHRNTDQEANYYYPAAYQQKGLKNIITVASIDSEGKILPSSNWGSKSVDVAAPGEGILSTIPNAQYAKMTGTSQATAFVSGIAALLLSKQPALTPTQLKDIIRKSVTPLASLRGKIATNGKVDAYKALLSLNSLRDVSRKMASQKK